MMLQQPPEVIELYKQQQRNPPPELRSMTGCSPAGWDVRLVDHITRAMACIMRGCDRLLKRCAIVITWVRHYYPKARSFGVAHAGGFVSLHVIEQRRSVCNESCRYYYTHTDGRDYCRATESCGCGHWAASSLDWRLKMASFDCPAGRFETASGFVLSLPIVDDLSGDVVL